VKHHFLKSRMTDKIYVGVEESENPVKNFTGEGDN
jgi:hypothetical protein